MATKKKAKSAAKKPARKAAKSKSPAATKPGFSLGAVAPGITTNDLEKSLAWYTKVVGFAVGERWEKDGKLAGVELKAGKTIFMLGQDDWQKGRDRKKGEGFRLYCSTTGDVDAYAAKIAARGGVLDQPPTDQPWGMRDFSLTDPDGFKITIGKELKKKR
jgi:uncharacterized glyoxalase superfamily protein PhnB